MNQPKEQVEVPEAANEVRVPALSREDAQRLINLCEKHYEGALDPAYHFKKQLEAALSQPHNTEEEK